MSVVLWLSIGWATVYGPLVDTHIAEADPLYCDTWATEHHYESTQRWLAVPARWYEEGRVRCGQWLYVYGDGWQIEARALDAGPLSVLGIVADVPAHMVDWRDGRRRALVMSVRCEKMDLC